jgi:hypothetical protein
MERIFWGGPALMITRHYNDPLQQQHHVGPGSFLAGIREIEGAFSEIKVGLMDSPSSVRDWIYSSDRYGVRRRPESAFFKISTSSVS